MEREDDVQLIQRTLSGDEAAFGILLQRYQKSVHALVWRKIGDFHTAEDITQDTFLQAYKKLSTLKNHNQFAGWLYVIANRLCIDWSRKKRFTTQSLEDTPVAEIERSSYTHHVSEQRETERIERRRELVKELLAQLPESERTVLTLYYLGEMTTKEIGKFLGVSMDTIKSRLRRGRKRLQKDQALMIQEVLGGVQIPASLYENVMRQVADMKFTSAPVSKPFLPWMALGTAVILIALLLGASNQYLLHFQEPYSFDAQSEPTIEIVDTSIILAVDSKPDVRNQVGRDASSGKNSGVGSQTSEKPLTSTAGEDFVQHEKNIELCTQNMVAIGKALQTYRNEHGTLPLWLSALHRKYLTDEKILLCPADENEGKPNHYNTIDPELPVSYDYAQFNSGYQELTARQRHIYGDVIPIVSCGHHANEDFACLNLSFSASIYRSSAAGPLLEPETMYGSIEKAVATFEIKLQDAPDDERMRELYPALVRLYIKDEQEEKADNLVNRFKLVMTSEDIKDNFVLGDMFEAMARHQEALQIYEEMEMQHPNDRKILQRLTKLHEKLGNQEIAKAYQLKYDPASALIGKSVPDFSATDLDGKPISLQDYRGKVVLLDFWAVWSTDEIPNIKKVYNTYKDAGFDVIGVSFDREESKLRNYIIANDIPWRQIFSGKGWNSPVARQYDIKMIPSPWLIDQEGKLISHRARGETLEKLVAQALKDKSSNQ